MYANIDEFTFEEDWVPIEKRPELDRWLLSALHSLIKEVSGYYEDYNPTSAARTIQEFVIEHLSNWYVRLSRRKFWKGDYDQDKIAAYQTLYYAMETIAQLMAPIAPFYSDRLFKDLNDVTQRKNAISVHLSDFPEVQSDFINPDLEKRMELAQDISSMALSLRKAEQIKVRQPLNKLIIPVSEETLQEKIASVEDIIKKETNIKKIEYKSDTSDILKQKIKPNFKELGPKLGGKVKQVAQILENFDQTDIQELQDNNSYTVELDEEEIELTLSDVEITTENMPGWLSTSNEEVTVALDVTVTDQLKDEGKARELVNRIQKIRKKEGLEVTDRIEVQLEEKNWIISTIDNFKSYICRETLAKELSLSSHVKNGHEMNVYDKPITIAIKKVEASKSVEN